MLTADDVDIKSPGRGLQPNAFDKLVGRTTTRALDAGRLLLRHRPRRRARRRAAHYDFRRPWGLAVALPRHRGDDPGHAPPTSWSSTSPTRTSTCRPAEVFAPYDGGLPMGFTTPLPRPLRRRLPAQPRLRRRRPLGAVDPRAAARRRHDPRDAAALPQACRREGGRARPGDRGQPRRLHHRRLRLPRASGRRCTPGSPPASPGSTTPACGSAPRPCRRTRGTWAASSTATSSSTRATPPSSPSATTAASASTSPTPSCRPTTSACPSPRPPTSSRRTAEHLHLVDATGVDGEGVQVGDGEIDWALLAQQLDQLSPGRQLHPGDLAGTRQRRRGLLDRPGAAGAMVLTRHPTALWVVPVSDLAGVARHVLDVARNGIPGWRLVVPDAARRRCPASCAGSAPRSSSAPFGPDHGLRACVRALRDVVRRCGRPSCTATCRTPTSSRPLVAATRSAPGHHRARHRPRRRRLPPLVREGSGDGRRPHGPPASLRRGRSPSAGPPPTRWREVAPASRPITVIPNGVDPVGHAARAARAADPVPGPARPREAARRPGRRLRRCSRRDHPEATLTLAGTGELEAALRAPGRARSA